MNEPSAPADLQLVTFLLDNEEYGVDVMRIREITSMTDITKTANSPAHVKGVINLRGTIVPIISLRCRFDSPPLDDESMCFIAVVDLRGELTGFVIDEISDVIRVRRSDIQPPPVETANHPWIAGILHRDRKLVVYLNIEHLV